MILIIDNYDSFTFNLAQAVGTMGYEVCVMRNDAYKTGDLEMMPLEALIISPGPGKPEFAGMCMETVGYFKDRLPILGICLGHQVIGTNFGGKVVKALRLMHGKTSSVFHHNDEIFSGVTSPFEAMRYHSLALDSKTLPPELEVIAETGEGEIMGIRHRKHRHIVGLQFHPESFFTPVGKKILFNYFNKNITVPGGGECQPEVSPQ